MQNIYLSRPDAENRAVEDTLAALVLRQAQEKRSRLIGTDRPGIDTANLEYAQVPGRLREVGGHEVGDLRSVLEYYQSLSTQRMVIIGTPGAGKTVLLLELQIQLLEHRRAHPDTPVPVVFSASRYDTERALENWLADQVSLEFSIGRRKAAALVADGRILPLVDGLDEMDPPGDSSPERGQQLVQALNTWVRGRQFAPVVVTCRPGEYARLAESIDKARHAELAVLNSTEAAAYLQSQFRTTSERDRWAPVLKVLEQDPDGPLAAELATPWKLTLALTAFRSQGDPAQLLPPAGITDVNYSAYAERQLLRDYVPSAVRLNREGTRYTYPCVQRWLVGLSVGLVRQARDNRSATDIILHERRQYQNGISGKAQFAYAALLLFPFLAASATGNGTLTGVALLTVFALSMCGAFFPRMRNSEPFAIAMGRRGDAPAKEGSASGGVAGLAVGLMYGIRAGIEWGAAHGMMSGFLTGGTAVMFFGVAFGLVAIFATRLTTVLTAVITVGITTGFIVGVTTGPTDGLTFGMGAGIMGGLANRFNFSPKAIRPQTIIRANGLFGFTAGLTVAFTTGIAIWFAGGLFADRLMGKLGDGVVFGFVAGFSIGLIICGPIWTRYHLSVAWNALRGRSPYGSAGSSTGASKPGCCESRESPINSATGNFRTGSRQALRRPVRKAQTNASRNMTPK